MCYHRNQKTLGKSNENLKRRKKNSKKVFVVASVCILLLAGIVSVVFYRKGAEKKETAPKTEQTAKTASVSRKVTASPEASASPWSIAKQSGRKEDFEAYFKKDLNAYTKERDVPKGKMKKVHYNSKVIGEKREVYVYTPTKYSKDKKYPVLYLLHGIGRDGSQWLSMQADNVFDNMIADGEMTPCVVVCPSIVPKKNKRTNKTISPENIEAYEKFDREFTKELF